jgi:S-methylmethionine-dependent homocysteine/selenocysteine methylase
MTVEQLMDFHRSRLEPVRGHPAVDIIAFETIPCLKVKDGDLRGIDVCALLDDR